MGRVRIVAEIGSSPAPAWDFDAWCAAVAATGADAVKAQVFAAEHFPAGEQASKRPLEFPRQRLREFVSCAHAFGLVAGVSVFDAEAARMAGPWCDFTKLAAREQFNEPLIEACYYDVSAPGLPVPQRKPVYRSVSKLELDEWMMPRSWTTFYAVQQYPAGVLRSLLGLLNAAAFFRRYRLARWGYSSHTHYALDCVLAARMGATVIEKHIALSPTDLEAGHSLLPDHFGRMVQAVRLLERKS